MHHPRKRHDEHRQCNPGGGVSFVALLGSDRVCTKIPLLNPSFKSKVLWDGASGAPILMEEPHIHLFPGPRNFRFQKGDRIFCLAASARRLRSVMASVTKSEELFVSHQWGGPDSLPATQNCLQRQGQGRNQCWLKLITLRSKT